MKDSGNYIFFFLLISRGYSEVKGRTRGGKDKSRDILERPERTGWQITTILDDKDGHDQRYGGKTLEEFLEKWIQYTVIGILLKSQYPRSSKTRVLDSTVYNTVFACKTLDYKKKIAANSVDYNFPTRKKQRQTSQKWLTIHINM